jgi:TonB family protein
MPASRAREDKRSDSPAAAHVVRKPPGSLEKEATERAEPVYPPLARAAKVTGTVVVEVTVDQTGNVIAARAISGHALLRDAAVEAARKWKFKPAKLSGAPVQSYVGLGIAYSMLGKYQEAIGPLKHSVDMSNDNPVAHLYLGSAYLGTDDKQAAMKEYEILKRLDPASADVLLEKIKAR